MKATDSRIELTRRTLLTLPLAAAVMQGAELPRLAPALKIARPGGVPPIDMAAYQGKVCGLIFLLTTCPHCQAFTRTLEKVSKELGPLGFQPVGAAINDPTGRLVSDYVKLTGATFPIGYVKQEVPNAYLQIPTMNTMYMPQLVLIDRKGMIRYHHPGQDEQFYGRQEENLRAEVKLLLAEKSGGVGGGTGAPKRSAKEAVKKS